MEVNRSGFVAIVGRPNVGKSTLLNAFLGEKIAAVSSKPQTTRNKITGIYTKDDTQLVFLDTPGLHKPRTKLGEYMVKSINQSITDVDAAILVIEPKAEPNGTERELLSKLKLAGMPVLLAINKIDTLERKQDLIGIIAPWSTAFDFATIVPISASLGDSVNELLDETIKLMPSGPMYFPDDILTPEPERAVVAEIIREKLLVLMSEEIPHGTAVTIEKMHEREEGGMIDIDATIYCERDNHKGMIIGKGGQMLKQIGILARADIERFLDCHINLQLWVKVKEDWRNKGSMLKTLGYN